MVESITLNELDDIVYIGHIKGLTRKLSLLVQYLVRG